MKKPISHAYVRVWMPINWELGLAPKIAGNWDLFPKFCWDFGISQKLNWDSKMKQLDVDVSPPGSAIHLNQCNW